MENNLNHPLSARRVVVHQAVDEIVDARRRWFGDETTEAVVGSLDAYLAVALTGGPRDDSAERAWQTIAAIAQGQLEQTLEERGGEA